MYFPVISCKHHVLYRIEKNCVPEGLTEACFLFVIKAVAGKKLGFMIDLCPFPETGNILMGVVPAILGIDRILLVFAYNM